MTDRPNLNPNPTLNTALNRRAAMMAASVTAASVAASAAAQDADADADAADGGTSAKTGRLNQAVCKWCYKDLSLEQMCELAAKLGLVGIDLLGPDDFPTLKQYGLVCTMVQSHRLANGLCDTKFHDESIEKISEAIESAKTAGYRNVICFSGNARGIDRETGMKNCVDALKKVTPLAEKAGVVLNMELLNSKVNHPDYMCDNSTWGVELCKRVGSDNFKLLYDIYHMQIMEGDIIRTIERDHEFFGHYHTGGNPGRHEIDETQELYYPPIARAIADTGFDGYFAHEFIPAGDPAAGLTNAVNICNV